MNLTGLHFLLTYTCNYECEHCFVWGSPEQVGTFNSEKLEVVLDQALSVPSIETIFFEGGEPFLFFPLLHHGIAIAHAVGFITGVVSNGYWAADFDTALDMLRPLASAGLNRLSISSDTFHAGKVLPEDEHPGVLAARQLGINADVIRLDPPALAREKGTGTAGQPVEGGGIMFRGRAAEKLTREVHLHPSELFDSCPHERLDDPSRVHVDPYGNLHLCQGLLMGNLFMRPLKEILKTYEPEMHPMVGPLLSGGPAGLASHFGLQTDQSVADACHLCYAVRDQLRADLPAYLGPEAMYGVPARAE